MKLCFYTVPAVLVLLLAGCHKPPPAPTRPQPICAGGEVMMQTTLWFTTSQPQGGEISSLAWQSFLDHDVTPHFRQGVSVYDAKNQHQDENGKLIYETRKAVVLIHGIDPEENTQIEALRERFKKQFSQPSVIRLDSPACVGL